MGVSKMIFEPIGKFRANCAPYNDANTISERTDARFHIVGVRTRGGPKPTSKCCVSLSWMVIQGEHTGVYPGLGKRRPYVQRGEKFVFPCTEVLV
jgi:hypothetical protein